MARGRPGRLHVAAKLKQSVLREAFEQPVPWRHKRREMMVIAGIIPVAKLLANIIRRSDVDCRLCKRALEQRGASMENLLEKMYRHINSTSVSSAMEWRQQSRLPTTSSGDICTPACKLHKHQQVSSDLSNWIKRVVWTLVAVGRV